MKKIICLVFALVFILCFSASCTPAAFDAVTTEETTTARSTEPSGTAETTSDIQNTETAAQTTTAKKETRAHAPDFYLTDANGKSFSTYDFDFKPVVINFWKSDCSPCKTEMPYFQAMYEKYGDDVIFIMADCVALAGETKEKGLALIKAGGYTFPVYFDTKGTSMNAYIKGAYITLPTTVFITADGYINYTHTGAIKKAKLEAEILKLLGE